MQIPIIFVLISGKDTVYWYLHWSPKPGTLGAGCDNCIRCLGQVGFRRLYISRCSLGSVEVLWRQRWGNTYFLNSSCGNRNCLSSSSFCIFLNCSYQEHEKGGDVSPYWNQNIMFRWYLILGTSSACHCRQKKYRVGSKTICFHMKVQGESWQTQSYLSK